MMDFTRLSGAGCAAGVAAIAATSAMGQSLHWVQRAVNGPSVRSEPAFAYDSGRRRVVLFGGYNGSADLGDTWEYDGTSWTQRAISGPPVRIEGKLAYDSARRVCVLFGGRNTGGLLNDTWEYDGVSWVRRFPSTSPDGRMGHGLDYDAAHHVTVLHGGSNGSVLLSDTWAWNGANWTQPGVGFTPPEVGFGAMVYDSAQHGSLLSGGFAPGLPNMDTYELYLGNIWGFVSFGDPPRVSQAMVFEPVLARPVVFGGEDGSRHDFAVTQQLLGSTWAPIPISGPSARAGVGMAYDSARGCAVLFGGIHFGPPDVYYGDTWELTGTCFANCDGSTTPPALNVNDFLCFQTRFAAGDDYANCDGSTVPPVLNVNDFICFQLRFVTGCP